MALPPWTVELLRRGVADLARQVTDHDTAASLKEQASKIVEELPKAARDKVDALLRQAESRTQPLKDAWQNSQWWGAGPISLTPTRIINGTGCLLDQRGSGVGLPAEALAAAIPHLSGDASRETDRYARLCSEIATTITRRQIRGPSASPAIGAIVTNSLEASLALVATLGGRGGCVWVPRSAAHPMSTAGPTDACHDWMLVERLRRFSRGRVREFGHVSGSEDWPNQQQLHREHHPIHVKKSRAGSDNDESAVRRQNVLVRLPSTKLHQRGAADPSGDWIEVVVVPIGSVFPINNADVVANVIDLLGGGADLVVLASSVLAGMPELSLVVGSDEVIQMLRQSPSFQLVKSPTAMTAIVAAATAAQANGITPVGELTAVSEENLNDRAQRLATQLAGCDWVSATSITDNAASIGVPTNLQNWQRPEPSGVVLPDAVASQADSIPSRQVVLTVDPSRDASTIAQRLAHGSTGLLCGVDGHDLIIDLRWISPEQQSQISELVNLQN